MRGLNRKLKQTQQKLKTKWINPLRKCNCVIHFIVLNNSNEWVHWGSWSARNGLIFYDSPDSIPIISNISLKRHLFQTILL